MDEYMTEEIIDQYIDKNDDEYKIIKTNWRYKHKEIDACNTLLPYTTVSIHLDRLVYFYKFIYSFRLSVLSLSFFIGING